PKQAPAPASAPWTLPEIFLPREPLGRSEDASMIDLFREEVRIAAVALYDGLGALAGEGPANEVAERLLPSAKGITGAALIVGVEPIGRLGQGLERALSGIRDGSRAAGATELNTIAEALSLLADVVGQSEEALPGWLEQQSEPLQSVCERLDAST